MPKYLIVYPEEHRAERLTLGPDRIYQTTARIEWGGLLSLLGGKMGVVWFSGEHLDRALMAALMSG